MKIGKIISAVTAAVMLISSVSCGKDLRSTKEELRTVMTIDGMDVPYEMYRYAAKMHLRDYINQFSSNAENTTVTGESGIDEAVAELSDEERSAIAEQVEAEATATVTEIYALFSAAKKEGIDPFDDRINTLTDMKMEELRATYDSDSDYAETLRMYNMNDSVYKTLTRYEIVSDELYELYVKNGDIDVSDEAAIEYFGGENAARAKQILISFERHSEDEAARLAEGISATVKDECIAEDGTVNEEKFDELTDTYGEDLFMFKNRDGYYISKGYNDKAFEDAVFALEIGEVSEPVRIAAGYSIILRAEKDLGYIEENIETLKEASLTGIFRTILEEYSANAEIEKTEIFQQLDIYSMK